MDVPSSESDKHQSLRPLQPWRTKILDGVLKGVFGLLVLALLGAIYNVLLAYQQTAHLYAQPDLLASVAIVFYTVCTILIGVVTFWRKLGYVFRAIILLLVFYLVGAMGLVFTGLSGDGRLFLFAFVLLAAILFGLRASLGALFLSLATLFVVANLLVAGVLKIPIPQQANSTDLYSWLTGGLIFLALGSAAIISLTYLMRQLVTSLSEARTELKERQLAEQALRASEGHLKQLNRQLRTLSEINQLIVRAEHQDGLVQQACELLVRYGEYALAWIAWQMPDTKLQLAASFPVQKEAQLISLENITCGWRCLVVALHARAPSRMEIQTDVEKCKNCPFFSPILSQVVALPIIRRKTYGALVVCTTTPHGLAEEEINILRELADDLAYALDKMETEAEGQARNTEMARLFAATQEMTLNLDYPTILATLARHLTQLLDVTSSYIMEVDLGAFTITSVAEYWSEAAAPLERTPDLGRVFPLQHYPNVARAIQAGEVLTLQHGEPGLSEVEREQFVAYAVQSMLFIPLKTQGRLVGEAEIWESRSRRVFSAQEIRLAHTLVGYAASTIENARLFATVQRREAHYRALIENAYEGIVILNHAGRVQYASPSLTRLLGYTASELDAQVPFGVIHPDEVALVTAQMQTLLSEPGRVVQFEMRVRHRGGVWRDIEAVAHNLFADLNIGGVVVNFRDITARKRAEESLRREHRLYFSGPVVVFRWVAYTPEAVVEFVSPNVKQLLGYSAEEFMSGRLHYYQILHPEDVARVESEVIQHRDGAGSQFHQRYRVFRADGQMRWLDDFTVVVKNEHGQITHFEGYVLDATDRQQSAEALHQRAEELATLAHVAEVLRRARSRREMIPMLLDETLRLFRADAGSILLLEEGKMKVAAARGPGEQILGESHTADDSFLWQAMQGNEPVFVEDIHAPREHSPGAFCRALMRGLQACVCVPLITAEANVGLLHLAFHHPRAYTPHDIRLLTALTEMGGAAIHRTTLYEQTQYHAAQLEVAYETTLAGWARALELRDAETQGHTMRVTELTVRLARELQLTEEELLQIRRGALLHDIGKMGVPDHILLKPGPLTPEEQSIMRQHPQIAYDMLYPIPFLRPALDIPYAHHEKWDGTGYPLGLKGEQIPLAARIFTVVDVWDALRSNRPYRAGWPEEAVRRYLEAQATFYFDPQIVPKFLSLVEGMQEVY